MGPTVEEPSTERVTRACYARGLDPAVWESLIRSAASDTSSISALEADVTSTLLRLLAEAPHSPTTTAYLRHSIGLKSSPSSSKSLVRPGYLARHALLLPRTLLTTTDLALAAVFDSLRDNNARIPAYAATTQEELIEGVTSAAQLLADRASSTSLRTPTIGFIHLLLSKLPLKLNPSTLAEEPLKLCVQNLNGSLKKLETLVVHAATDAEFLQNLRDQVGRVRNMLDRAPHEVMAPLINLDERTTFPDPDIFFLVSDLLHQSCELNGISNTESSVARIAALLKYRVQQSASRGSTVESALTSAFLEILLAATADLRRGSGRKVVLESFVFSRLPEVFGTLFMTPAVIDENLADGLQAPLSAALQQFKSLTVTSSVDPDSMEVENTDENLLLNNLVVALCRQELISIDVGASLGDGLHPEDLQPVVHEDFFHRFRSDGDPDSLKETLHNATQDFSVQRAIITGLVSVIQSWTQEDDLSALAVMCSALVEMPEVLELVFLHVEPKAILSPIRAFLEACDTSADNFGDGPPIERYGTVVLFLQVVISRFNLRLDLPHHLGTDTGFFVLWLPSIPAVFPLSALDDLAKSAVDDWVSALFGEGISDDLTQSTNPQVLLRCAPTICKQCIAACDAGVLDLDTLKGGFSYFLQDLLSFTLPGIILWILSETLRIGPQAAQTTMYDILEVFIFDDALPRAVLEIVSHELHDLEARKATTVPSTFDFGKLAKLLAPYPREAGPKSGENWLEQLGEDLESLIESPGTTRANLALTFRTTQLYFPARDIVSAVLDLLVSLHRRPPLSFNVDATLRAARVLRAGTAILSAVSRTETRWVWPLLDSVVRSYLPAFLPVLAGQSLDADSDGDAGIGRAEALADIVGDAVESAGVLAAVSGEERAQVGILLDYLAMVVRRTRRKAVPGGTATRLDVWAERFKTQVDAGGKRDWGSSRT